MQECQTLFDEDNIQQRNPIIKIIKIYVVTSGNKECFCYINVYELVTTYMYMYINVDFSISLFTSSIASLMPMAYLSVERKTY